MAGTLTWIVIDGAVQHFLSKTLVPAHEYQVA